MIEITTNDLFAGLVRDLSRLSLEDYCNHYTELTRRVIAEGSEEMTQEIMHGLILTAANTTSQTKK